MDYDAIGRVFGEALAEKVYDVVERESDGASTLAVFAMAIDGMDPAERDAVLGALTSRLDAVLTERLAA